MGVQFGAVTEAVAEINECRPLFLADFQDLGRNGIRVVVAEGTAGRASHFDRLGRHYYLRIGGDNTRYRELFAQLRRVYWI
jgi:accessory colonization factor AcfC